MLKITHVCLKSHMCGKNHTCVEFTTQEVVLEVVGQKHTCVGKTTVNLYFYEVAKIKHVWLLSNTYQIQGVWKKTHIFVKKTNMCVFSHTGGDTFCICTCIFDT